MLAISEPFAGSDVARIRTTAVKSSDGRFYIVSALVSVLFLDAALLRAIALASRELSGVEVNESSPLSHQRWMKIACNCVIHLDAFVGDSSA